MSDAERLAGAYAHCEALLRDHDKDRYLANLFLPASARPHVAALHAFSLEVARVRDAIHEPMAGELRHQWWRDALSGRARGDAAAHPVAAALIDTVERFRLDRETLIGLIDARTAFSVGYNGTGIAMASLLGRHALDIVTGESVDLALMHRSAPRSIPFYFLREPAVRVVAGWYQFLDSIGR